MTDSLNSFIDIDTSEFVQGELIANSATEFSGLDSGDYTIAKMVTGETLLGVVNKENGTLDDVALLIPIKPKEGDEDQQLSFYTIPYGMPLINKIEGESVSLTFIIKCFPVMSNMQALIDHYEKVKKGDFGNE